jgi:hypothetical protein
LDNHEKLDRYFNHEMDEAFLTHKVINGTMVFTNKNAYAIEIKQLAEVIDPSSLGQIIAHRLNKMFIKGKSREATLINSTHHLYHLMQFECQTGIKLRQVKSVVEFGGGYGNMARIFDGMAACERYSIIDMPLMSCFQYVFLCATLGREYVSFNAWEPSQQTKLLLAPLTTLDSLNHLRGELFLSTWALSESPRPIYDRVVQSDWCGARNLLLAYSNRWKPWAEEELSSSLKNHGWQVMVKSIPFLPDCFYLFGKR